MLGIHVADGSCVCCPFFTDSESQGIQDVHCRASCRGTDVTAPPHDLVVVLGWDLLGDFSFVHVDDEHLILLACDEDFSRTLRRPSHASQLFHVLVLDCPERSASPLGHMYASGAKGNDALVVEQQLVYLPILGAVCLEASVLRELRAVEGGDAAVFVASP